MIEDVTKVVKEINDYLISHDFKPRDADASDFAYGPMSTLRFKTGTVYGEVSIQVVRADKPVHVIRIINEAQIPEVKHEIDRFIANWRTPELGQRPATDGDRGYDYGRSR
jgi:hypothetical protein